MAELPGTTPARGLAMIGLGARVALTGLALLNTFLLARWLGPAAFGTYALFVRTVSVLTMFGDLGQAQSATAYFGRLASWSPALHAAFLRTVAATSLGTALVAAALAGGAGAVLVPGLRREWLWLICALLPLTIYSNFWYGMMVGRGEIRRLNVIRVVVGALSLLYTIVFVGLLSGAADSALKGFAAVTVVQVGCMALVTRRLGPGGPGGDTAPDGAELVGFGLRAYGNVVFYVAWTSAPLFVLNAFHGPASVGVFSIAQQLVDKVLLPVQAVQEATYRRLASIPVREAAAVATRYLRAAVAGSCAAALVGVPTAAWGIVFLLGDPYAPAARLTALLLLAAPFMAVMMVLDPFFVCALRRPGLASLLAAGNLAAAAALSLLMIPALAAPGAVGALALTQCAGAVAALLIYKRRSDSEWHQLLGMGEAGPRTRRRIPLPGSGGGK